MAFSNVVTPWGIADDAREIAPGLTFYTTPGHGGFLISETLFRTLPMEVQGTSTFAGGRWYEEDCDAAIIVAFLPHLFEAQDVERSRESLKSYKPELYAILPAMARTFPAIVAEIVADWHTVNFAAKPYLDSMRCMDSVKDTYGMDAGSSIVLYFLSNATTWKGETARRIKAELKALLKNT